jgi:phosphatidylinositol dimannoside acyltransferase
MPPTVRLPDPWAIRSRMSGRVSDLGYAAGWQVVRAMPEFAARNAFDAGAWYAASGGGPQQLRRNLARVLGVAPAEVPPELIRASLSSYARYWREVFRLPSMNEKALAQRIEGCLHNRHHLDAAVDGGRGVVLALPHSGNWDMGGVWIVQHYGPFTTVAERLKPESLYRRFLEYREKLGFETLPLTGGQRPPFQVLADRLRANRFVCLMADRDLTHRGVEVDFFGEPSRMPAGPATLAIETGAPLHPVHCYNTPDSWVFDVYPALDTSSGDVGAVTQALADAFAEGIANHPADWHMLQPQWIADLSADHRARIAGGQRRDDPRPGGREGR